MCPRGAGVISLTAININFERLAEQLKTELTPTGIQRHEASNRR